MKILFTCAGRRNYLLQYFREAVQGQGEIWAADMDRYAPAFADADRTVLVPSVYANNYIDELLKICADNQISLLISLNDLELPILAERRDAFQKIGTTLLVSDKEVIDNCFDKWRTLDLAKQAGVGVPLTFLDMQEAKQAIESGSLKYPVMLKPRWGSASIGLYLVHDEQEMDMAYIMLRKQLERSILKEASREDLEHAVLIQEKLAGKEYGVDILNDLKGNTVSVLTKEKMGMRAGETDRAALRLMPELSAAAERIGKQLQHIGNCDADFFVDGEHIRLLELNPRFGGGYPFSQMSGARFAEAIIAWVAGTSCDVHAWDLQYDVVFSKCDTLIRVG